MKSLDDLLKDPRFQRRLLKRIEEGWTFEKIEPMSTDEIFARLNRLGIKVTPENYHKAAERHESAQRLAEEWYARYPLYPEGRYDEDFVWMAAIILWKRLVPERVSFEQIDEKMQQGYDLLEAHRTAEACDAWWQVWEWLKDKIPPERNTLDALDEDFRGMQSICNWCGHFEMELGNAGLDNPEYHQRLIRYCQEFLEIFADIEWSMRGNFLRAEAEAYWNLNDIETAEAKFKALIETNPNWAWGYIGWSDAYWLFRDSPKHYDRAESILRQALDQPNLEDREVVQDRLKSLKQERMQTRKKEQKKSGRSVTGKRQKRRKKRGRGRKL